jgi:hypothetical protein
MRNASHDRPLLACALLLGAAFAGCQIVSGSDDFTFAAGGGGAGAAPADGGGGSGGSGGEAGSGGGGSGGEGGVAAECEGPEDCPGTESDCLHRTCVEGVCGQQPETANAECNDDGGKLCNGSGLCVPCLDTMDCMTPQEVCDAQLCVPAACSNTMPDAGETDIDCGGEDCSPCENTKGCNAPSDCTSNHCDTSGAGGAGGGGGAGGAGALGVCAACDAASDCTADEYCTATGTCVPKLADGQPCGTSPQCQNNHCVEGVCCDTACGSKCQSCRMFHNGGEDGTCGFILAGSDPYNECLFNCNGSGFCL